MRPRRKYNQYRGVYTKKRSVGREDGRWGICVQEELDIEAKYVAVTVATYISALVTLKLCKKVKLSL